MSYKPRSGTQDLLYKRYDWSNSGLVPQPITSSLSPDSVLEQLRRGIQPARRGTVVKPPVRRVRIPGTELVEWEVVDGLQLAATDADESEGGGGGVEGGA